MVVKACWVVKDNLGEDDVEVTVWEVVLIEERGRENEVPDMIEVVEPDEGGRDDDTLDMKVCVVVESVERGKDADVKVWEDVRLEESEVSELE